jgi:hypothetical protein
MKWNKSNEPKEEKILATTVRVPRSFWNQVRIQAVKEGVGTGELIVRVLNDYLKTKS